MNTHAPINTHAERKARNGVLTRAENDITAIVEGVTTGDARADLLIKVAISLLPPHSEERDVLKAMRSFSAINSEAENAQAALDLMTATDELAKAYGIDGDPDEIAAQIDDFEDERLGWEQV